jgi:hypothetical protein
MAKTQDDTGTNAVVEYSVWFNAPDGVRRELRAIDSAGVQQAIADIHANEDQRQVLAASVGLNVPDADLGIEVFKTTTTTELVVP